MPSLRLDGVRPISWELTTRLAKFWVPGESVVYIGLAGTSVGKRVRQCYRTPLGDRRPHAGGHWVRTLRVSGRSPVWWAPRADPPTPRRPCSAPSPTATAARCHSPTASRPEGQEAARHLGVGPRRARTPRRGHRSPSTPSPQRGRGNIVQINAALEALASAQPDGEIDAVSGGVELERLGLLADSASRPGKPLRDLLRAGHIVGAYQDGSRRWHIPSSRGPRT